ncbi:polymorphic toxin type 15 domain-containing protein [Paracoccus lutimaris]|uniref:Putative RNase toxin 15 of polymorphic toxin system n=1 Tax=Paracoccus lutimaris TaxID=1490030 RepID=A0A368Z753_9RHOB|nr:polymorphic toxin type 15 domain-containing protein [Paracoccus lutimaris]RCW88300.1 putative RNase toxin 15 of polymorphic toxin system [Paracoccus lutimaris]
MSPRQPPNPSAISQRSERSAYAEATPATGVVAPCMGPVMVCANYDDRWRTPVTMSPLRITDMNGKVVLDGGARTLGLPSFGMQDGQAISGVRPQLGTFTFNAATRGPASIALVGDPSADQQIKALEAQIIEDLRAFATSMETALQPWINEWNDQGWMGVVKTFFESARNGISQWWDGEGEFWAAVWDWLSKLPEVAEDAWDSLSSTTKALWENRARITELLEALSQGAVNSFEACIEALKNALAKLPGLEEIAETFRQLVDESAEWVGAMIEMMRNTRVLDVLGGTVVGIVMTLTPNFWADIVGTVGGYLIPEIILAAIFAVLTYFTAGTAGGLLAARLTKFTTSVVTKLKAAGKAGKAALKIFEFLTQLTQKMLDLIKALKRKIEEAVESATDVLTRITRRAGRRIEPAADLPCFKKPFGVSDKQFDDQLREQEAAINNSDLSELIRRRDMVKNQGTKALRDADAQRTARTEWINARAAEIMEGGQHSRRKAVELAQNEASKLDATHVLDIVAGGDPSAISGLQDSSVNRSIGRQWRDRVGSLDDALAHQKGKGYDKAHVKLKRC